MANGTIVAMARVNAKRQAEREARDAGYELACVKGAAEGVRSAWCELGSLGLKNQRMATQVSLANQALALINEALEINAAHGGRWDDAVSELREFKAELVAWLAKSAPAGPFRKSEVR